MSEFHPGNKLLPVNPPGRPIVIDGLSHGIEANFGVVPPIFVPWYLNRKDHHTYYYTRKNGWERVEEETFIGAYNHIARSRRMPLWKPGDPESPTDELVTRKIAGRDMTMSQKVRRP